MRALGQIGAEGPGSGAGAGSVLRGDRQRGFSCATSFSLSF